MIISVINFNTTDYVTARDKFVSFDKFMHEYTLRIIGMLKK